MTPICQRELLQKGSMQPVQDGHVGIDLMSSAVRPDVTNTGMASCFSDVVRSQILETIFASPNNGNVYREVLLQALKNPH